MWFSEVRKMREYNVDIKIFKKKFDEEYEFLYKNRDQVAGFNEAVEAGDKFLNEHGDFVGEFANYRGDFITSDREVAAFMFALDSLTEEQGNEEKSDLLFC